jgi:hypothetical protein
MVSKVPKELQFTDLKTGKKFTTSKFTVQTKGGRRFAVAVSPSNRKTSRFIKK